MSNKKQLKINVVDEGPISKVTPSPRPSNKKAEFKIKLEETPIKDPNLLKSNVNENNLQIPSPNAAKKINNFNERPKSSKGDRRK